MSSYDFLAGCYDEEFRDGALDGLDGTVLIDTLNVHGDDLARSEEHTSELQSR